MKSDAILLVFTVLLITAPFGDCQPAAAAVTDLENYTYRLDQSTDQYTFWTTTPTERVFKDAATPDETGSGVRVYAAKNEFEPFQVVIKPASSGTVRVDLPNFGSGIVAEMYQVKYVYIAQASDNLGRTGDYPDPLLPVNNGADINVTAGENTAVWINLYIPPTAPSGDISADLRIGGVNIPVTLHIFNFSVPEDLHVKSQMNVNFKNFLIKYSVPGYDDEYWFYVDKVKQFFIDHRLTPKGPLWPGGLTSNGGACFIDYDCAGHFSDPHGIWGFVQPADKYLNGNGFNDGVGFPGFMAVTFQNNDASSDQRPSEFCGHTRQAGDWYTGDNTGSGYNTAWFDYMHAMQEYLRGLGYLSKSYYYMANEPQNQEDYDAVAWYAQALKSKAPDLKLAVSEQPRPEIYDHPVYTKAKIDIWLAAFVTGAYDPDVSMERQKNHGEESWIYFLHGTRPPYFNPITLDHPGIESKFTGWLLWKFRLRGIAYYSMNNWSKNPWTDPLTDDHNGDLFMLYPPDENNGNIAYGSNNHRLVPSIRFELMRDSLEDYEYLYVFNGNQQPQVDQTSPADAQVDKIISGLTSYTRDSEYIYNLRRFIGLKNGGEIETIPNITPKGDHPRADGPPGNYYINFQDPDGSPQASPLVVSGHEYMKIGWNDYDKNLGYGWFGDMAHVEYRYLDNGPNELQKSIIYDDWGRQHTFEFDLPNGQYRVTVSVGWFGRRYNRNKVSVEGVDLIDDEPSDPYLARSGMVTIRDRKLTLEMGIFDEYTMLNYLDIEAVGKLSWLQLLLD